MSALDELMEAVKQNQQTHYAIVDWKTAQDSQWELAALREENEKLRGGAELGPIVGMEVIAIQKQKLDHLAAVASDVNEWLKTIDLEGTGHQRSLEAALKQVREAE